MTRLEFLERARESHGYKYTYPNLSDKILSSDYIDIIYKDVLYRQKVVKHILLGRCPEKNTQRKTNEQFIKESISIWGNKYDYSLVVYENSYTKVDIIYDGIIFKQSPKSHLAKSAPELQTNQEYFIKKSIDKWGNKYDYSLVKYIDNKTKVKIIFRKTGEIFKQTPNGHLNSSPENINLSTKKTTEQFIKEANIIHDNKFDYTKTKYIKSQIKVIITCPKHGDFTQTPLSHLQGCGCNNCNESKGEKAIAKYLDKNYISYYRQHKFNDCKNIFQLPFDFYIPKFRLCIEFDGIQHYQPIDYFGGIKSFEKIKANDIIKNDYCEDNFIELIRIRYDDYDRIEIILNEVFRYKL